MEKILSIGRKRGFPNERLRNIKETKEQKDERGYYIYTVNEGAKVYFEDFYTFMEGLEGGCVSELISITGEMESCDKKC